MNRLVQAGLALALLYTSAHIVESGIIFPLERPNIKQVIEELQPMYRQVVTGTASVDHGRQYGPVFLLALDPVYRRDVNNETRLAWYAYGLGLLSIAAALTATIAASRRWLASRGRTLSWPMIVGLVILWGNFGPLYGVLAVKNVELWELALIMVACLGVIAGRPWIAGGAIAIASLTKMLPFVFMPYLLLRDRRLFARAVAVLLVVLAVSQLVYGTEMGFGYLPLIARAAGGTADFGWQGGIVWHENISLRGLIMKAFGYLHPPSLWSIRAPYSRGYFTAIPMDLYPWARLAATLTWAVGMGWVVWTVIARRTTAEPGRTYWDWALIAAMMLPLAPQASQDYMVMTLGAFSFVLIGCMVYGGRANWVVFGLAVLLVANVLPRSLFARLIFIDAINKLAGHEHLTRPEAYQYYGFPLLGLLLLMWVWTRIVAADDRTSAAAGVPSSPTTC
jgi:hypothetical protein